MAIAFNLNHIKSLAMKKVIFILMFFGILFAMCACQDSHEPFAMDANVTCVDNESVAIDNLINSLDSLNSHYQMYACTISRSGDNLQQQEQPPLDSLHLIPSWVDEAGTCWASLGGGITGEILGTVVGGPATGTLLSWLLGTAYGCVFGTVTSSIAQYLYDCSGLAMVTNPGYIYFPKLNLPVLGSDCCGDRFKEYYNAVQFDHNKVLNEIRSEIEVKEDPTVDDLIIILQMCVDKYNTSAPDSLKISISSELQNTGISYATKLAHMSMTALSGEMSYTQFVDSTCSMLQKECNVSSERIKIIKDFNSQVHAQYGMLPEAMKSSYATDIVELVQNSTLPVELKDDVLFDVMFGMNSADYWIEVIE
ncbi:hypothetical protein C5O72_08785 [Muribaculum intestinale]|jgi:hypothetical protein|uniref:Glycine zipper family protein n=2 Tax=Muribaculum intestinale TaxID=1796646 RepID=A0A1B1SB41_9BACT|nr:hypothetical protein [Muribaculum intestinale]ANU64016.1 hypothetical protein A4V02_10020 [Muribaculum intestinale]ASB37888.1 hypothetical protein ADH68_07680 [Muribaculum intestinale]PWB02288.1 hypothetical protein C5O29_08685 [Muribaculum intestinale]PWB09924.1 hypothetical protein C5O72_08785 [Muribaculum intestinale]